MFYNRIARVWVLDPVDYFLIAAFIASILASRLKDYLSEEVAMERLKNSLIEEIRWLESSKSAISEIPYSKRSRQSKIEKIYKFALNTRGGQAELDYQLADKIKNIVLQLAVFLKKKELRGRILKTIFTQGRLVLQLVLYLCKIDLRYVVIGELDPQVIALACCAGGTTGFVCSWFSVGAILFAPPTILSFFLLRSATQQFIHNVEYRKLKDKLNNIYTRLLEDKDFQKEMQKFREEIRQLLIGTQKEIDNSNKITIESLNWNKNPEIKAAAERLGIFESPPDPTQKLNLDLLEADTNKILEEIGVIQQPNPVDLKNAASAELTTEAPAELITEAPTELRTKAKTVYFSDKVKEFRDQTVDDLDLIDAEIIKEPPLRVKIKDSDVDWKVEIEQIRGSQERFRTISEHTSSFLYFA